MTLSLISAMEGLIDTAVKHLKGTLDDYVDTLKEDLEVYAEELVRKVAKAMAVGMLGATLLSAGVIFCLIGVVVFLGRVVGAAAAWGSVGVTMAVVGVVLLFAISKMTRATRRTSKHP
jgi:hypothetical protein